jgi:phosphoesterase RecJ-like protein
MMSNDGFKAQFEEIRDIIGSHERFLILGHIDPDGDCLGSMFALGRFLERSGKQVRCYAPGEIAAIYKRLAGYELLAMRDELPRFDHEVVFTLDSPTPARTSDLIEPDDGQLVVNIDHHPTNELYGKINIVEGSTSAAAILVYRLISFIDPDSIDEEIADYLYLGIMMDTGGFRFQNTNSEALACAAELVDLGARPHDLAQEFLFMKGYDSLKLLGIALGSLELHCDGRLAVMVITQEMLAESGGSMNDTEGFVDYPASIESIELCALMREIGDREIRVSLRSRSELDVSGLAEQYGGGGHRKAAGLTIHDSLESARSRIIDDLASMLAPCSGRAAGGDQIG